MCGNDCQKKMFVAVFVGQHGGEKEKKILHSGFRSSGLLTNFRVESSGSYRFSTCSSPGALIWVLRKENLTLRILSGLVLCLVQLVQFSLVYGFQIASAVITCHKNHVFSRLDTIKTLKGIKDVFKVLMSHYISFSQSLFQFMLKLYDGAEFKATPNSFGHAFMELAFCTGMCMYEHVFIYDRGLNNVDSCQKMSVFIVTQSCYKMCKRTKGSEATACSQCCVSYHEPFKQHPGNFQLDETESTKCTKCFQL